MIISEFLSVVGDSIRTCVRMIEASTPALELVEKGYSMLAKESFDTQTQVEAGEPAGRKGLRADTRDRG